jgi:organic hydroperoxide reductase OsmC/OhrA
MAYWTSSSQRRVSWVAPAPRADVESLVQKAHLACPYSNATCGNIDVRLLVV